MERGEALLPRLPENSKYRIVRMIQDSIDKSYLVERGGKQYFMKIIGVDRHGPNNPSEVDLQVRYRHPNLINIIDIVARTDEYGFKGMGIILPLAQTTLFDIIGTTVYTLDQKLMILYKIINVLNELHHAKILHLDVKPENILLINNEPYITDFGYARMTPDCNCEIALAKIAINMDYITPAYRPPEIYKEKRNNVIIYGTYCDVWSLALTMIEFLFGSSIYPKSFPINVVEPTAKFLRDVFSQEEYRRELIERFLLELRVTRDIHDNLYSMLMGMLEYDPERRLSLDEVAGYSIWDKYRSVVDIRKLSVLLPIRSNVVPDDTPIEIAKICNYFTQKSELMPAQCLFLAVDLYYRICHKIWNYSIENREKIKKFLAISCIWLSITTNYQNQSMVLTRLLGYYDVGYEDIKNIDYCIDDIIAEFGGVIQPYYLFYVARNEAHLKDIVRKYFFDVDAYLNADLPYERLRGLQYGDDNSKLISVRAITDGQIIEIPKHDILK